MGFEKIGLNIGKEFVAWVKTDGKSLLTTRPVKVNIQSLKLVPLKSDTAEISNSAKRWLGKAEQYIPNCSIPNCEVSMHHDTSIC